jgi:phosphoglycolate phosphatase (TIGR01487 family)
MKFRALACDYDGTLTHDGIVSAQTIEHLSRLKESGRRLLLVTGRQLPDLLNVFPEALMFDRIVAENGAVLFDSDTRKEHLLAGLPSTEFLVALQKKSVPVAVGKVIVATVTPHDSTVLQTIHELGLDLQVIFNKGAVMILPAGIDKASGLQAALADLGISRESAVCVGDAENDLAMFGMCGCSAAVANALPIVKERAHIVTSGEQGEGVCELIGLLLNHEERLTSAGVYREGTTG